MYMKKKKSISLEQKSDLIKLIATIPGITMNNVEKVIQFAYVQKYMKGDIFFRQGDTGVDFYVIAKGKAKVIQDNVYVITLEKGEIFGEMATLRNEKRCATVVATTSMDVFVVPGDVLHKLIACNKHMQTFFKKLFQHRTTGKH